MSYRFPTPRKSKRLEASVKFEEEKEAEKPGRIQGKMAGSINEWYVAKALWALRLEFQFQYPLLGGTHRRGGIVIDFLVKSEPNWLPLEVQSLRWHTGKYGSGENLRLAIIESILHEKVRFVWEEDTMNLSDAIQAVKKAVYDPAPS